MMKTWTPRRAAGIALGALAQAEDRLAASAEKIAREWGDVDQYICDLADRLRDCAEDTAAELREAISERLKAEEENP